jgi:hypothetical protein
MWKYIAVFLTILAIYFHVNNDQNWLFAAGGAALSLGIFYYRNNYCGNPPYNSKISDILCSLHLSKSNTTSTSPSSSSL